jgi:catechol 2,3-dioxygenase-like lactoylglutathione lyase family enzyme
LSSCTYHWSSTTTGQSSPISSTSSSEADTAPSSANPTFRTISVETTSWAVADCPENSIARRLLCPTAASAAPARAAGDDLVTGLPRPKPWFLTTAKDSPVIKSLHVETPLALAAALGFYRRELGKRGWTEIEGAVVEPDRAVLAFVTADGPALIRLVRQDDRTIADLSLRKPAAANAGMPPRPGQARLMLGNSTDDEAVITINDETMKLAARAGGNLTDEGPDIPEIDLPPGRYRVSLKVAGGGAQNREFEVAADETWGLLAGPAGVPLPMRLY